MSWEDATDLMGSTWEESKYCVVRRYLKWISSILAFAVRGGPADSRSRSIVFRKICCHVEMWFHIEILWLFMKKLPYFKGTILDCLCLNTDSDILRKSYDLPSFYKLPSPDRLNCLSRAEADPFKRPVPRSTSDLPNWSVRPCSLLWVIEFETPLITKY